MLITVTFMTLFVCTLRLMASYVPQEVENIAGVLRWLHFSCMVNLLRPMSTMEVRQCKAFRNEIGGKKFGLGWIGLGSFGVDDNLI